MVRMSLPLAGLAAGAVNDGRRPTLSWRDDEVLDEHRFPTPRVGLRSVGPMSGSPRLTDGLLADLAATAHDSSCEGFRTPAGRPIHTRQQQAFEKAPMDEIAIMRCTA